MGESGSVVVEAGVSLEAGAMVGEGRYRILNRLGGGGMGSVYAATDLRLDRKVAIKVLHEQNAAARALLRQEASLLATLHDPRVIAITDLGEAGAALFMVTEYLEGPTLQEFMDEYFGLRAADGSLLDPAFKPRPIPAGLSLRIGSAIAGALEAVHSVGYIHRDLKPANLMLKVSKDTVDWLKLIDFGLSARSGVAASRAGTPVYLAPETAEEHEGGLGGVTGAGTDLYSLGCLLYELLTGEAMFDGTDLEILEAHQGTSRPRVNTGFDELDDFLATLVARRLEDRPTSAKAVSAELARLDADLSRRSTQVAYKAPVDLSTRKLPPRAEQPQAVPTTQEELVALQQPRRVWPMLLALSFAVLVLAWWAWARARQDDVAKVPTVEAPPEVARPVAPLVSPEPLAAVAVPDSGDILEPLVKVTPRPVKPVFVKAVIAAEPCEPDERWRANSRLSLSDLGGRAAGNRGKFELFEGREAQISRDIASASTSSQCAAVEASLKKLLKDINE